MSAAAVAFFQERSSNDVRDLVRRYLSGDTDVWADFVRPGDVFRVGECSPATLCDDEPRDAQRRPSLPACSFLDVETRDERGRMPPLSDDDGVRARLGDTAPVHAWFWISEWPEERSALIHCPSLFRDGTVPWQAIARAIAATISASCHRKSIYKRLGALDPLWVVDAALEHGDAADAAAAMLSCIGVDYDLVTVDVMAYARDMVLSLLLWRLRELDRAHEDLERVAEIRALLALEYRALQGPSDPAGDGCETCDQAADFVLPIMAACHWTPLCRACFVAGHYLSAQNNYQAPSHCRIDDWHNPIAATGGASR